MTPVATRSMDNNFGNSLERCSKKRRCNWAKVGLSIGLSLTISVGTQAAAAQEPQGGFKLRAESPDFWKLISRDAQLVTVARDLRFTEGPVWDPAGFLYVSDEELNKIFRVYPDGRKEEYASLGDPDGNTYDAQHRLLDCASVLRAIIRFDADGKYQVLADKFEGKRFNSPNDIVVGPDGAIYFTDPTLDLPDKEKKELSFQGVYRLDSRGKVTLLTSELSQPNGLAFSPDGKKLYVDDSEKRNIRVYDLRPDGAVTNGKIFGEEPGKKGTVSLME